jgi:thioesterase domain-containing protein
MRSAAGAQSGLCRVYDPSRRRFASNPNAFMKPVEIEGYLHNQIPLSADMGVTVVSCDAEAAVLRAPLTPNINHRATVFGGSASAVAILAAWTWMYVALRRENQPNRLVIQRNAMEYLAPITGDFEAHCAAAPPEVWTRFLHTLQRRGRARLALGAELRCGGVRAGAFRGDYVAMRIG